MSDFTPVPPGEPSPRRPRRGAKYLLIAGIVIVFGLVAARLALPSLLRDSINRRLDAIPDYTGRVETIDVSLLRGAYTMRGLRIEKREGDTTHPFVTVEELDFSLVWRELFRGRLVSEIVALRPRLNFVQRPTQGASQLDFDRRWQEVINDLFPIEITHFEATEGELHFVANFESALELAQSLVDGSIADDSA